MSTRLEGWLAYAIAGTTLLAAAALPVALDATVVAFASLLLLLAFAVHAQQRRTAAALRDRSALAAELEAARREHREAVATASLAEQRFRFALDGSSVIAWACDAQRRYNWAYNPGAPEIAASLLGRAVGTTYPRETFASFADAINRVWETGLGERLPISWTHAGVTRHYLANIDPVKDDGGHVVGLVGASVEVTNLHHANHAAVAARAELQTVVDTMPAGVCRCTRDLQYRWASQRYLDWLGRGGETVIGRPIVDVLGEALYAAKRPYIEQVLDGRHVEFEQEVPWPDGTYRWIRAAYAPTYAEDGSVDGWVAVITDLTERHRTEEALRESEERLRLALEGAQIGQWTTDIDSGRTSATPFCRRIFGLPPDRDEAWTRAQWNELIHPDDRRAVAEAWAAAADGAVPYHAEYRIVRANGDVRWVDSRGCLHRSGRSRRVLGITMDVTERKAASHALLEADRRKNEFLATLAHELRNPLAPIRYASRLFTASLSPAALEDLGRMLERQLAHMSRLLDDLLDVSRITRGHLELRHETVDLAALVVAAADAVRPLADAAGHTLETRLPGQPLPVHGDATRLLQVLGNLLNNAVKYTDAGGRIAIEARADDGAACVEVCDTGIGIAPELLPRVFDLFMQGDRGGRGAGGLGIGLALARQLVERHGGTLEAHSEGAGAGSRFVVRLPLAVELAVRREAPTLRLVTRDGRGTEVLVADDNRDAADALAQVLRLSGYVAHVAYDGATALALAERVRPTVALLDLGLPELSGYEVARRLRAEPWTSSLQLIAVTGWGAEEDRRRSGDAGFDHHLTKPVDPDLLVRLLAQAVRGAA